MPTPPRSGLSSRNSIDGNEFPRKAGKALVVSKRDHGLISPAKSTFSFADEGDDQPHQTSNVPDLIDEKQIARTVSRGTPGDSALVAMVNRNRESTDLSRRKSQFYSEVFAYREPNVTARDRVHRHSIISAEIKTNVIIKDEYVFLQDLSQHLSQRYHRPTSSIFITLQHSACLLFAGSFESAYLMTITALPSQIQPVTNKRNSALVQAFMADSLGVTPDRGVVRFVPVAEEDLATNGTTVLGEIETLRQDSGEENRETTRSNTIRRGRSRKASRPERLNIQERSRPGTSSDHVPTPPLLSPPVPAIPTEKSPWDKKAEKVQRMGRRRSFLALFGK
ncbi:MAG: hypothetical protein Q9214_005273 [Letrouitia sp. 1 TL-2023]